MRPAGVVPVPAPLAACSALLEFDGAARHLVARVKYANQRAALGWLAPAMAALVDPGQIDVVTWAPTTAERRRARGFDHAELLARRVARVQQRQSVRLLRRGAGPAQTGRTRTERRAGPSFQALRPLGGARVLVVDDVVTTGATMAAAATALRAAGASIVVGLAAAHTS